MISIDDFMGLKVSYFSSKKSEWFIDMSLEVIKKNELENAKIKRFNANI